MRFANQVVLVTGSSSGIGAATARLFAAEGATLVVNSVRSVEAGEELAASLPSASYVQADVGDGDARKRLIDTAVERHGRLDVLVNNAGVTEVIPHHDLEAVTEDVFRRIFEVNVLGTFELTKLALPHLKASGRGAVINISSVAGLRQVGSSIPYSVSKAAVNHMTKLLANACGPEVRVNAVAPGLIRTPWTQDWEALHDAMDSRAPLGRSGTAEEVAESAVDLAANQYVTGHVLVVDGGFSLRN